MNYVTVFDGYAPGINWDFPVSGLFAIALGVLLVMNHKNMTNHWARNTVATAVFAYCFLSFAFIWTLVGIIFAYSNYQALSKPQDVKVVAGIVTNFSPMNSSGHKVESFCVLENCFQYSDYVLTGGFNTTSAHGGPIREGLRVRVSYIGDVIVKLEIAD